MSNCQRAKPALHSLLPSNKPYRFPSNSIRRGLTSRIDDTIKLVWRIYSSSTSHSPLPSKSLSQVRKSTTVAQVHSNGNWLIRRLLYVVGSGVVIALCCNRFFCETIPYSNRRHFVIFSPNWEKKVGDTFVKTLRDKHILPATHPQTIRVRRIANNITEALQREIISDRDRDQDREKGSRVVAATSHLNGKKWDIYVEVNPQFYAKGLVGARGTIVISTGFLHHLKRDEEIATIISHEIAHDVARHTAEEFSNPILLLNNVREAFHVENGSENYFFAKLSTYLFSLSQRMEMEADYIGMLLLASAGYDPKVAPDVYTKLGKLDGEDPNKIYNFSTHPSGKMRAEKLAQAHIMEEALSKYQDVRVNDIENFVESQKYRQEKIFMHSAQWLGTTIRRWGQTHLTQRRQPHLGGRAILTPTRYTEKY